MNGSDTPSCSGLSRDEATGSDASPLLVFDGGCPFCRHFALWSELSGGIPGLRIADGRARHDLRRSLERQGYPLRDGAVLVCSDGILHGAAAIHWLCSRFQPSPDLRRALATLMASPQRARRLYPLLLLARRLALGLRGLPLDPDPPAAGTLPQR